MRALFRLPPAFLFVMALSFSAVLADGALPLPDRKPIHVNATGAVKVGIEAAASVAADMSSCTKEHCDRLDHNAPVTEQISGGKGVSIHPKTKQ